MNKTVEHCRGLLDEGLQLLGLSLPENRVQALIDYLALLQKWNRVYNLTAITEPRQQVIQHLLDSLCVLPYIETERLLDVGTGAGLPGLVLAIARPELACTLLDSNSKKTRFLTQASIELGLTNVQVFCQRSQQHQPEHAYPLIISRAYASLEDMVSSTGHCLAEGGRLFAMKGHYPAEEIEALQGNWQLEVEKLRVPMLDAERHLLKLREKPEHE